MNVLKGLVLSSIAASALVFSSSANAKDVVVASDYGYDAEDATDALQRAIDSGAKKVVVDKQSGPWIVRPIKLRGDLELTLQEGVEVVAKSGAFQGINECLFRAADVSNLTIRGEGKGATIRMRKKDYWEEPYKKSEWRHGVSLLSSENVTLENLTIAETGGDGVYLGVCVVAPKSKPCRNITIKNVDCVANNRQGISVISVDGLLIEDSLLRDTVGTAPASGIDFEPNKPDEQITNVVMRRVKCVNNAGDGVQFYLGNLKNCGYELTCLFDDCECVRNSHAGFIFQTKNLGEESLPGSIVVKNTKIVGNRIDVSLVAKCALGAPAIFENVKVTTLSAAKATNYGNYSDYDFNVTTDDKIAAWQISECVSMTTGGDDLVANGGVRFNGVEIVDASDKKWSDLITCRDASWETVGFEKISGNLALTRVDASGKAVANETIELTKEKFEEIYPASKTRRVVPFNFETLNQSACAELSQELAKAWSSESKANGGVWARQKGKYAFYLEKGKSISWTLRQRKVGSYAPPTVKSTITPPSGKASALEDMPGDLTPKEYSYLAQESGWHLLDVVCGNSTIELTSDEAVLTSVRPSISACYSTGTYRFYVPNGSKDLGVRVTGSVPERVTVTILDPDGKQVERLENVDALSAWSVPLDANEVPIPPKSGFWTLKIEKPTVGVLEDYSFSILGVPGLMK